MTDSKKPGVDPTIEDTQNQTPIADQASSEERRRAVKNILAGSGVVAGAAATSQWSKPIVDAVMLPAHAQTSGPVTLVGNVSVSPTTMNTKQPSATDVLDFFIGTANAGNQPSAPDLAGSCMTMMVDSTSFDLLVEFASAPSINVPGTVSNGAISGSNSGVSVTGNVDLGSMPPTAMGQISNGSGMFNFMLDDSQTNCSPIEVTTTPEPTTTPDCANDPSYGSGYAFNTSTGYCEFTTVPPPTNPTTTLPPRG